MKKKDDSKQTIDNKAIFADAEAVWHMADLSDSVGNSRLAIHGDVKVGVELEETERKASIKRGGDGYAAEFRGGYLIADGEVNLTGKEMTICIRIRESSGKWDAPIFSRYDRDDRLSNILCGVDANTKPFLFNSPYYMFAKKGESPSAKASKAILEFMWRTRPEECVINRFRDREEGKDAIVDNARDGILHLRVPVELIGATDWHDVIIRFCGPNLEMFVDGVLVDEDWPYGELYKFIAPFLIGAGFSEGKLISGFHGFIDHLALWNRALSDNEIVAISGGKDQVDRRKIEILGEEQKSLQYWRPRGYNEYAGDCMLLYQDGKLHLFWLFDRRHHSSKWHLGAHQYAHASTEDLVHWEHHHKAVPIVEQWECAMGTGDFIYHDGTYYAFYTDCGDRCEFKDKPHKGSGIFMAISNDGIHYTKRLDPVVPGGDCTIFRDESTGFFHLLTPGSLGEGKHGIIDYVSPDLKNWEKQPRLFHDFAGCCPHLFQWNKWYYFTVGGRFWKSQNTLGPWTLLRPDQIDHSSLAFPKTAGFKGNRKIAAGWIGDGGWGGDIVFRELVQMEDGSLGSKFPLEMIPESGSSLSPKFDALTRTATGNSRTIEVSASDGFGAAMLTEIPQNVRISLQVKPGSNSSCFGLCMRGSGNYQDGCELRFETSRQRVQFGNPDNGTMGKDTDYAIVDVDGLDSPFTLDIIVKGDIFDVCIDNRRTIVKRCASLYGNRLFFFVKNGGVTFDSIEVCSLLG